MEISLKRVKSLDKFKEINKKESRSKYLVIQFEDNVGIRVNFNEFRYFKVKFFLGLLGVSSHHRKGLMVLGKIYQPDDSI